MSDSNRSIATLAITTLLKTGNENSIDRLMKQISSFMGEIGDEFKIVVVKVRVCDTPSPPTPLYSTFMCYSPLSSLLVCLVFFFFFMYFFSKDECLDMIF